MVCSNYALLQVFASEFPNNAGMPHIGKLLWSWFFSRVSIACLIYLLYMLIQIVAKVRPTWLKASC